MLHVVLSNYAFSLTALTLMEGGDMHIVLRPGRRSDVTTLADKYNTAHPQVSTRVNKTRSRLLQLALNSHKKYSRASGFVYTHVFASTLRVSRE